LLSAAEIVVLLSGSLISAKELCCSIRVVIRLSVTSLTKVLLAQLFSFVGWSDLGRVWGHSIFFPFPNDGAHCALGNFQHSGNCFIPFPRLMPHQNSILAFSTCLQQNRIDSSLLHTQPAHKVSSESVHKFLRYRYMSFSPNHSMVKNYFQNSQIRTRIFTKIESIVLCYIPNMQTKFCLNPSKTF